MAKFKAQYEKTAGRCDKCGREALVKISGAGMKAKVCNGCGRIQAADTETDAREAGK